MLLLLLLAAEPSAPPLLPAEPGAVEQEPTRAKRIDVPAADEAPAPTRGRRLLGTGLGAVLGDLLTTGLWFLQIMVFAAACGVSCLASPVTLGVTGVGSLLGLAPLGPLIGNRVVGGEAPYWKLLLGTAAGGALAAITIAVFESVGFFQGPSSTGNVAGAVGVGALQVMMAQALASELGAGDP